MSRYDDHGDPPVQHYLKTLLVVLSASVMLTTLGPGQRPTDLTAGVIVASLLLIIALALEVRYK